MNLAALSCMHCPRFPDTFVRPHMGRHDIFECVGDCAPTTEEKKALLYDIWRRIDWSRPHFAVLNQASASKLEYYIGGNLYEDFGFFNLSNVTLRLFDSRLENFEELACGWTPGRRFYGKLTRHAAWLRHVDRVSVPLFHWPPALAQDLVGCANKRSVLLSFRGSCNDRDHKQRRTLLQGLPQLQPLDNFTTVQYNLLCGKSDFHQFAELLCTSQWALTPSGSFPPTFMMYVPKYTLTCTRMRSHLHACAWPQTYVLSLRARRPMACPACTATIQPMTTCHARDFIGHTLHHHMHRYESMMYGALPLFTFFPSEIILRHGRNKCRVAEQAAGLSTSVLDANLPFYDEGVRFSTFGVALLGPKGDEIMRFLQGEEDSRRLEARQKALKSALHRFTPDGTFAYVLRNVRRWTSTLSAPNTVTMSR